MLKAVELFYTSQYTSLGQAALIIARRNCIVEKKTKDGPPSRNWQSGNQPGRLLTRKRVSTQARNGPAVWLRGGHGRTVQTDDFTHLETMGVTGVDGEAQRVVSGRRTVAEEAEGAR